MFRRALLVCLLLAAAGACMSRTEAMMQEAQTLYLKNQYRESVRMFLRVVDRSPGSAQAETALLRVGEIFMLNLHDQQNALEYFNQLINEFPNGDKAIEARGHMAHILEKSQRNYDEAVNQYRRILETNRAKEPEKYIMAIGHNYYLKEDYRQAVTEYRRVVEGYPNSRYVPEAEYEIANCYFVSNKCEDAVKQYQKVLDKYPDTVRKYDIMLSIGVCMEDKEDYSQALKIYRDIEDKYENKALIKKRIESTLARMQKKHR